MKRALGLALLCLVAAGCSVKGDPDAKDYDLSWTVHVNGVPAGARTAMVWIAVPQERQEQRVSDLHVKGDWDWKFVDDPDFHNKVALVTVTDPPADFTVDVAAKVRRYPVRTPEPASLSHAERKLYLREEALVRLSPRIRAIADSVGPDPRALYDYVLNRMDYDKTVPGWGHGDSERACEVGKGNCTDFHSLFMSLARAEGIPTYFEMGYATTPTGEVDRAGGYHCWAWYYRDGAWNPVDISEADLHPDKEDFCFGHLDADRIAFSKGRDVKLPGMEGPPLNYLPAGAYVEVDGRPLADVSRTITYQVLSASAESTQASAD
jgi:hypothetical protein